MEDKRNLGKEALPNAKQTRKIISDALSESNSLVDTLREALGINIRRTTNDSNLLSINKRINKALQSQTIEFDSVNEYQKQIAKNTKLIEEGQTVNENLANGLTDQTRKQADLAIRSFEARQKTTEEIKRLVVIQSEGGDVSEEQIAALQRTEAVLDSIIDQRFKELNGIQSQYVASQLNTKELEKQNKLLDDRKEKLEKDKKALDDNMRGLTLLDELLSFNKGIKDISNTALMAVENENKTRQENGEKLLTQSEQRSVYNKKFIEQSKILAKQFALVTLPYTLLVKFVQELFKANEQVVDLQKNLGLTVVEATELRQEFTTIAAVSGDINITATKLLETFTSLNKQFGFITNFSDEILQTTVKLSNVIGISEESSNNLAALAATRGDSLESNLETILGSSRALQAQRGVQISSLDILEKTGKVTGLIRANLQANPEAIAEALTLAKQFGTELEQINSAAEQLLDFESSIKSELQAELLIGRDLNLERARFAALNGDLKTVAEELTKEAGDYTEFLKLNVIQRQSLAQSLGIEVNQLEEALFNQLAQTKSRQELLAIGGKELLQRAQAQTLQQKLTAATEKFTAALTDVGVALIPVLDIFTQILGVVGQIFKFLEPIMGLLTGAALGAAAGSVFGGVAAIPGAIAGGLLGLVGDSQRVNDAIITPDENVLTGPAGTFQFNPKDTILAGTDLFGERMLNQMPDYTSVLNETNIQSPEIKQQNLQSTQIKQQNFQSTTFNENFDNFISRLDRVEAAINNQTKVLSQGQDIIAKTKTKLSVGATDFGTEINMNSFNIQ